MQAGEFEQAGSSGGKISFPFLSSHQRGSTSKASAKGQQTQYLSLSFRELSCIVLFVFIIYLYILYFLVPPSDTEKW